MQVGRLVQRNESRRRIGTMHWKSQEGQYCANKVTGRLLLRKRSCEGSLPSIGIGGPLVKSGSVVATHLPCTQGRVMRQEVVILITCPHSTMSMRPTCVPLIRRRYTAQPAAPVLDVIDLRPPPFSVVRGLLCPPPLLTRPGLLCPPEPRSLSPRLTTCCWLFARSEPL